MGYSITNITDVWWWRKLPSRTRKTDDNTIIICGVGGDSIRRPNGVLSPIQIGHLVTATESPAAAATKRPATILDGDQQPEQQQYRRRVCLPTTATDDAHFTETATAATIATTITSFATTATAATAAAKLTTSVATLVTADIASAKVRRCIWPAAQDTQWTVIGWCKRVSTIVWSVIQDGRQRSGQAVIGMMVPVH